MSCLLDDRQLDVSDLRHALAVHLRDDFLVAGFGSWREVPFEAAIVRVTSSTARVPGSSW